MTEIANVNLNLLAPLESLLRERSVTRAAERLGVSQPAMSASLARLRRHFGDPLLVRRGQVYELTPLAELLQADAAAALAQVGDVFAARQRFDPATTDRCFTVLLSDYALGVLGEALSGAVADLAPRAALHLGRHTPDMVEQITDALRDVDGIVLPRGLVTEPQGTPLFDDTWVLLVDGSSRLSDAPTLADLAEATWVAPFLPSRVQTAPMRQLESLGVSPEVRVTVDGFVGAGHLVAGTDRVAMVPGRLAQELARTRSLRSLPLPFSTPPLRETFWWHPLHRHDPGHLWLRQVLQAAASSVGAVA
ncbi:LysR family transcriptional regulator [Actinotalea sp. C106]|uniref:LysR family transcriptional regulator n=1 Tax=Actinotalea sp. C106 TaxID=2908644 RepID=UPI002028412D|nr:LysR family transcriptional regulator [Actinotalea sp. C106]